GTIAGRKTIRDRFTSGRRVSPAKRLRYNAIVSGARSRCLVMTPPRLQNTAAATMHPRPRASTADARFCSTSTTATRARLLATRLQPLGTQQRRTHRSDSGFGKVGGGPRVGNGERFQAYSLSPKGPGAV